MATVLEPSIDRGPTPESSDRSFGYVFAMMFALIGSWPLVHWQTPRWWALAVAVAFAAVALVRPQTLHPLNVAWLMLGRVLHKIVSPVIMGLVFFLAVTPTAWFLRLRGKDVLSLKRRPDLKSYWIKREDSRSEAQAMKNQF